MFHVAMDQGGDQIIHIYSLQVFQFLFVVDSVYRCNFSVLIIPGEFDHNPFPCIEIKSQYILVLVLNSVAIFNCGDLC